MYTVQYILYTEYRERKHKPPAARITDGRRTRGKYYFPKSSLTNLSNLSLRQITTWTNLLFVFSKSNTCYFNSDVKSYVNRCKIHHFIRAIAINLGWLWHILKCHCAVCSVIAITPKSFKRLTELLPQESAFPPDTIRLELSTQFVIIAFCYENMWNDNLKIKL